MTQETKTFKESFALTFRDPCTRDVPKYAVSVWKEQCSGAFKIMEFLMQIQNIKMHANSGKMFKITWKNMFKIGIQIEQICNSWQQWVMGSAGHHFACHPHHPQKHQNNVEPHDCTTEIPITN